VRTPLADSESIEKGMRLIYPRLEVANPTRARFGKPNDAPLA
jgi:hypothetical protein